MMPGGRGMNPKMLQQMMKQLGITVEEMDDVQRVIIETPTRTITFEKPAVSAMKSQGQTTYQVVGEPKETKKGAPGAAGPGAAPEAPKPLFTDEDVKMVMQASGADQKKARAALEESEGEVAAAILALTEDA